MELWKDIPNTNGEYRISSNGKIVTTKTGRVHKVTIDERGYERVRLFKVNRKRMFKVHRLVAITFIPNPYNKEQVNHKDGNKRNNCVDNLEWVTNLENMRHSRQNGLHDGHKRFCEAHKKPVIATHIQSGEEIVFDSIMAARNTIGTSHVQEVIKGLRYEAKGYTFRYAKGGDA